VGVEPHSMTALFCQNTPDRTAATWQAQLEPWDGLEFLVADAAKGIAKAVKLVAQARRDDPARRPLEQGLDLFHTTSEAQRLLAQEWRRAEAAWQRAEAADPVVRHTKRQGLDAHRASWDARPAWRLARKALEQVEAYEQAWKEARAAFELFDERGHLNDRRRAEAILARALPWLAGPRWLKVRNFLKDRRSLVFLDPMHRQLEAAEPRRDDCEALAWRWWLSQRPRPTGEGCLRIIRAVGRERTLSPPETESLGRIAAVLERTCRASSAVECLNSVLRMQQSRHRRMTQPMLDLKRLFWNCHRFDSGPRRGQSPYQALGLKLPTFDFWTLLQTDPQALTQTLSTAQDPG